MKPYTDAIIATFLDILPSDPKEWQLVGIVNKDHEVFTFGNDSKIVGRAFEVVATSYIKELAAALGYAFRESTSQTVYPDFILEKPDGARIAIDVKSTYRRMTGGGKTIGKFNFTLGSFTSYLRNGTKNIDGHYSDYEAHYVLAFLYSRTDRFDTVKVPMSGIDQIPDAFDQVEVMFMEKHRIGGDKKGSGNTDNIATISANHVEPFNHGYGPFAVLGNDVYEHYWRHYPRYTSSQATKDSLYTDLPSYLEWLEAAESPKFDPVELRDLYEKYKSFIATKNFQVTLR